MNSPGPCRCLVTQLLHHRARHALDVLVRVHEHRLVTEELIALHEGLREAALDVGLQPAALARREAVPELWAAVVQVVDAREVEVLDVGREHRPEAADVEVGLVDAAQPRAAQRVTA